MTDKLIYKPVSKSEEAGDEVSALTVNNHLNGTEKIGGDGKEEEAIALTKTTGKDLEACSDGVLLNQTTNEDRPRSDSFLFGMSKLRALCFFASILVLVAFVLIFIFALPCPSDCDSKSVSRLHQLRFEASDDTIVFVDVNGDSVQDVLVTQNVLSESASRKRRDVNPVCAGNSSCVTRITAYSGVNDKVIYSTILPVRVVSKLSCNIKTQSNQVRCLASNSTGYISVFSADTGAVKAEGQLRSEADCHIPISVGVHEGTSYYVLFCSIEMDIDTKTYIYVFSPDTLQSDHVGQLPHLTMSRATPQPKAWVSSDGKTLLAFSIKRTAVIEDEAAVNGVYLLYLTPYWPALLEGKEVEGADVVLGEDFSQLSATKLTGFYALEVYSSHADSALSFFSPTLADVDGDRVMDFVIDANDKLMLVNGETFNPTTIVSTQQATTQFTGIPAPAQFMGNDVTDFMARACDLRNLNCQLFITSGDGAWSIVYPTQRYDIQSSALTLFAETPGADMYIVWMETAGQEVSRKRRESEASDSDQLPLCEETSEVAENCRRPDEVVDNGGSTDADNGITPVDNGGGSDVDEEEVLTTLTPCSTPAALFAVGRNSFKTPYYLADMMTFERDANGCPLYSSPASLAGRIVSGPGGSLDYVYTVVNKAEGTTSIVRVANLVALIAENNRPYSFNVELSESIEEDLAKPAPKFKPYHAQSWASPYGL